MKGNSGIFLFSFDSFLLPLIIVVAIPSPTEIKFLKKWNVCLPWNCDNCGSYFFLPNVSHLLWVHWLFGIQLWLCFAVNRERPGKSDLAVLRSVWDQDSTTDAVLLSADSLGPTWEGGGLLAAQTAERGKWKRSRSKKTAKTKTKPRQQKGACWGNF